jgi:hypothetical protein
MLAYVSMYRLFEPTVISGHTRLICGRTRHISGHLRLISGHRRERPIMQYTVQSNFPSIISEVWEWHPLRTLSFVFHCVIVIQKSPLQGYLALTSSMEQILVVTMPSVAEMFKCVINAMSYGSDFKLINLLHTDNVNLTQKHLNDSIDVSES